MEGLYISPDHCLQLMTVYEFDYKNATPKKWKAYGITKGTELVEWSAVIEPKDEMSYCNEQGEEVAVSEEQIVWPDGTTWDKMTLTTTQIYILTYRRPTFYTPMAIYMCMVLVKFLMSRTAGGIAYFKQKIGGRAPYDPQPIKVS